MPNLQFDPLMKAWRLTRRLEERRQPSWAEIGRHLAMPFRRRLFLVRDGLGLRPPFCCTMFPLAAELLGVPTDFHGGAWADGAQSLRLSILVHSAGAAQAAVSGPIPPEPRAADRTGCLKAVAVPLASEETHLPSDVRLVLLAVAWPKPA